MHSLVLGSWVLVASLVPAHASAFHGQADFAKPALEGGGGGRWFTGSPRFRRWDCTVCHTESEGRIRLTMATDPPELVREGRFAPGATYAVTISMAGEHRGLGSALNPNTFVLEIVDDEGLPAGIFAGLGPGVSRPPGEELVVARGELDGATEWTFEWIAPEAGTGPATVFLAGVDGDGAGGRLGRTGDPFGDDVFVGSLRLSEDGNVQPDEGVGAGGCSAAGSPASSGPSALVVVFALLALGRRARRKLLLPAAVALAGCHDPAPFVDPCVRGICESRADAGEADADGSVPGTDGAPPIDGGGLMRIDSGVDAGPPPDGCVPDWLCTGWSVSCGDTATRTCTDANACGSDWRRPAETRVLPALDEPFYRCRVQPILDRSCSQLACHGTEDRPLRTYSRVKWRINPAWRGTHNDGGGSALTAEEWCRNMSSARLFAPEGTGDTAMSQLLTQPLSPSLGGLAHAGYTLFYETSDPDYQTIRAWLEGASLPSCDAGFND